MKVKNLISKLQELDQESEILICDSSNVTVFNFTPYTSSISIRKKEMQYRQDLFCFSNACFDKKKYPIVEKYVLQ